MKTASLSSLLGIWKWITSKLKGCAMRKFVEKEHFHDLINKKLPWKKWKPESAIVTVYPFLPLFSFQEQPQKLFSKVAVLKFCKIPSETPAADLCLVGGHRPSYLQKLNCAACFPWNFKQVISRNIFHWLL